MFLRNGANSHASSVDDETPKNVACRLGQVECAKILGMAEQGGTSTYTLDSDDRDEVSEARGKKEKPASTHTVPTRLTAFALGMMVPCTSRGFTGRLIAKLLSIFSARLDPRMVFSWCERAAVWLVTLCSP